MYLWILFVDNNLHNRRVMSLEIIKVGLILHNNYFTCFYK